MWVYFAQPCEGNVKQLKKFCRAALLVLTGFLALSAVPGGLALIAGFYSPPVTYLQGSVFKDFRVPGLALMLVVGGSGLLAFCLLVRGNRFAALSAAAAGLIVMSFEFVEVLVIGSPAGPAQVMQIFYFGLGAGAVALALGAWFVDLYGAGSQ